MAEFELGRNLPIYDPDTGLQNGRGYPWIVELADYPGVYGVIAANPDGTLITGGGGVTPVDSLLLETGDDFLLETGDLILLES